MIYFNNYLYDPKRSQLPEHSSNRPGATSTGPYPSSLPLPTLMQLNLFLLAHLYSLPVCQSISDWKKTCIFIPVSVPLHPDSAGYYPNQCDQVRRLRQPFIYHGGGGAPSGSLYHGT